MLRYLWPLVFFGTAGYVWHYNGSHGGKKLLFPFLDTIMPSLANDPDQMGMISVGIIAALGAVLLVWTVVEHVRQPSRSE